MPKRRPTVAVLKSRPLDCQKTSLLAKGSLFAGISVAPAKTLKVGRLFPPKDRYLRDF
jgi:hypothetical protein